MPRSKIDWIAVDERIPIASDAHSREARHALFQQLDTNRNGSLSLSEAQSAVSVLLRSSRSYRGHRANALLVPLKDYKPSVKGAYKAAASLIPESIALRKRENVNTVSLSVTEFHAFLLTFRWYLELQIIFEDVDTSGDRKINYRECAAALSYLKDWDINMDALRRRFPSKRTDFDGGIDFDDFAQWAIKQRFGSLDLSLDLPEDAEDNDQTVARAAVQPPGGPSSAPAAPAPVAAGTAKVGSPRAPASDPVSPAPAAAVDAPASVVAAVPTDGSEVSPAAGDEAPASVVAAVPTDGSEVSPAAAVDAPASVVAAVPTDGSEVSPAAGRLSWAEQLILEHRSFSVGDRVEAIYNPTGSWCTATIAEVRDGIYVLGWDPAGDFIFRLDREKRGFELRPEPVPGDAETVTVAVARRPARPSHADATDAVRRGLGAAGPDATNDQDLIEQHFQHFDADGNGSICGSELGAVLKALDTRFDDAAVEEILNQVDLNHDGAIDYREFVAWLFAS